MNLIGEHTDYSEGYVMPAAIGYETTVRAVPVRGRRVTVRSSSAGGVAVFDLDTLPEVRSGDWTDYPRGVLLELRAAGVGLLGAELTAGSSVPLGAGLSSSASFEVAIALAMLGVSGASLDRLEIARLAQRAEVERVGIRCGIMDQFAVLFGVRDHAVLLDTRSLRFERIRIPAQARLVVCNSMVRHALANDAYNERRAQAEAAADQLRRWDPNLRTLRDVTLEELDRRVAAMPAVLARRARHVVSENARVLAAAALLEAGDLPSTGALMNASHASLRDDYEVSCPELDALADIAQRYDGVYGARMTGGGFGGCTVNLVDAARAPAFAEYVVDEYRRRTGLTAELYDGTPVDGASVEEAADG